MQPADLVCSLFETKLASSVFSFSRPMILLELALPLKSFWASV
jgi:hypothetical protein